MQSAFCILMSYEAGTVLIGSGFCFEQFNPNDTIISIGYHLRPDSASGSESRRDIFLIHFQGTFYFLVPILSEGREPLGVTV